MRKYIHRLERQCSAGGPTQQTKHCIHYSVGKELFSTTSSFSSGRAAPSVSSAGAPLRSRRSHRGRGQTRGGVDTRSEHREHREKGGRETRRRRTRMRSVICAARLGAVHRLRGPIRSRRLTREPEGECDLLSLLAVCVSLPPITVPPRGEGTPAGRERKSGDAAIPRRVGKYGKGKCHKGRKQKKHGRMQRRVLKVRILNWTTKYLLQSRK